MMPTLVKPSLGNARTSWDKPLPGLPPLKPLLITSVTLEAALIGIESARLALKCTENEVMALIASGRLEWAFDLRARETNRTYIRILTQSVVKLQQPRATPNLGRRCWKTWVSTAPSFEEVFESIFRHHRPWIRVIELVRAWSCSHNHIKNLVGLNLLEMAKKSYSAKEARLISRQSVAAFMQQRKIQ